MKAPLSEVFSSVVPPVKAMSIALILRRSMAAMTLVPLRRVVKFLSLMTLLLWLVHLSRIIRTLLLTLTLR